MNRILLRCIRTAEGGIQLGNQIMKKPGKTGLGIHLVWKGSIGSAGIWHCCWGFIIEIFEGAHSLRITEKTEAGVTSKEN
ncbi:MAG: hypothetical protein R6V02_05325 [Candidatus Aminicenantes bacterium]